MEEKRLKHIMHQIRARSFCEELMLEIRANGTAVFDELLRNIAEGCLSKNQLCHALEIMRGLLRQECFGRQEELISVLFDTLRSEEIPVASKSIEVATLMLIANKVTPDHFPIDGDIKSRLISDMRNLDETRIDEAARCYMSSCFEKYELVADK